MDLIRRVALQHLVLRDYAAPGTYVVTTKLLERDGESEYRMAETYERMARESELRAAIIDDKPLATANIKDFLLGNLKRKSRTGGSSAKAV